MAGQRKRLSKEQSAEAVELARTMLVKREHKHAIKAALRRLLGPTAPRTCERLLARARALILENIGRGKLYLRALSLAGYEMAVADPDASVRDRIKALERVDRLMGLEDRPNQLPALEVFLSYLPAAMAEQFRQALRDHLRLPPEPAEPVVPPPTNGRPSRLPRDPDPPLF
jgi:hypothetical protein